MSNTATCAASPNRSSATATPSSPAALCSGANAGFVRGLGADHVVDYQREDFATGGKQYDAIMDCVGNAPFERVWQAIKPGGALLLVVVDLKGMLGASGNSRRSGVRVNAAEVPPSATNMAELTRLAEAGVLKPVIDRRYEFADLPAAVRYQEEGHAPGKVVVAI